MDRYFDIIYYALAIIIFLALGYSFTAGVMLHGKETSPVLKRRALGLASAAAGTALALLGGLMADSFLKGSSFFQQARFASYYVGFVLITFGLESTARASQKTCPLPGYLSRVKITNFLFWLVFFGTLAISLFYLANPATFVRNQYGIQVQREIYWLPMLAVTLVGAIFLFWIAFELRERNGQGHLFWIGAFAALIFIGLLRESLILPDLGNPLTNLLAAFVPFVIGSFCLGIGARMLYNFSHSTPEESLYA